MFWFYEIDQGDSQPAVIHPRAWESEQNHLGSCKRLLVFHLNRVLLWHTKGGFSNGFEPYQRLIGSSKALTWLADMAFKSVSIWKVILILIITVVVCSNRCKISKNFVWICIVPNKTFLDCYPRGLAKVQSSSDRWTYTV